MSEDLTPDQLLSLVPHTGALEGWVIWDYRRYNSWKLGKEELAYFLAPEYQIMSTLAHEPVFNGEFLSEPRNGNAWKRLDYPEVVLVVDDTEKIIVVLSAPYEIKTRSWWLSTKSKYSEDWNNAIWHEI